MEIKAWISAFRLRTLPLALSCIGMGGFLAAVAGKFNALIFLLCCLTTVFLQVLSNLANDYGDSVNGVDHTERSGPKRAVQSGAISLLHMKRAVVFFVLLCLVSGVSLLLVSIGWNVKAFLFFFGVVGVMGSLYLFTRHVSWLEIFPALTCGLFSIAVLNINNIRDIESDRKAGKFSIPVRIGKKNAVIYHWILLGGGLTTAIVYAALTYRSPFQFLFLLALPLFLRNGLAVTRKAPVELDPYLKQMALSTMLFVILFGIGFLLA